MTIPTYIRLKKNYYLVQDPNDSSGLLVYDTEKKIAFLRIRVPNVEEMIDLKINHYAHSFQSLKDLSRVPHGKILIMLYHKSPNIFEQTSSDSELLTGAIIGDIESTVDFNQCFLTYSFSEKNDLTTPIILWGNSQANLHVFNLFANLSMNVSLVISTDDEVDINEMALFDCKWGEPLCNVLNHKYSEKKNANIFFLENEKDCHSLLDKKALHIVNNKLFLYKDTKEFWKHLDSSAAEGILYYGMHEHELTIGPFVIPGESATYEDFLETYKNKQQDCPMMMNHIAAGMMIRISYFILTHSLKYLAADVQIPINSAFCIDQYSLNSKLIPIIRGTRNENSSEKYSKVLS